MLPTAADKTGSPELIVIKDIPPRECDSVLFFMEPASIKCKKRVLLLVTCHQNQGVKLFSVYF